MFFFKQEPERDTWADEEAWSMHCAEMRSLEGKTDPTSLRHYERLRELAIEYVMGWTDKTPARTREETIAWLQEHGILIKPEIVFRPVEIDPDSFNTKNGPLSKYGKKPLMETYSLKSLQEGKKYYGKLRFSSEGVDELDADGNFIRRLCGDELIKIGTFVQMHKEGRIIRSS